MWKKLKRILRHRWVDEDDVRRVLPPAALERLQARVQASEQRHSGQIRLAIEAGLPWSYLWREASARERAVALFGKLRVWDTEHNNGVLIYLLLSEHAIEIVADRGVSRHVTPDQWQVLVDRMRGAFRAGRFEEGLSQSIDEVTALLVERFPGRSTSNELPDAPVTDLGA